MVCRKEKPDFEVKSVVGQYGGTYLIDYTFCPFCHCKTETIIYSSKGIPETGDCWIDCSSNYIARCRTVYGEDKSCSDLIAKMRQNRDIKKQKEENEKRIQREAWRIHDKYLQLRDMYKSDDRAFQATLDWVYKDKELVDFLKKNRMGFGSHMFGKR